MASVTSGPAQYLVKFGEQSIAGNQYALTKLGIDRANCSLKIEEYLILCVPYQLGFRRSIFMASLSKQEVVFFQKYLNGIAGLSLALNPNKRPEPVRFFLRCTLSTIGQMKGRENVGLFAVDYKTSPDEMVSILGNFMDAQERSKSQYEDYGKTLVRITPVTSKMMGYNSYATITEPNQQPRRIQIFNLNTKTLEYVEAPGSPVIQPGTSVSYQLFFRKFRINVNAKVNSSSQLPQGIIRTISTLEYNPELVEIIDEYWYSSLVNTPQKPVR